MDTTDTTDTSRQLLIAELADPLARLKAWLKRPWIPPRVQAFEFCDQSWLRGAWREAYMDGLEFLFNLGGVYRELAVPFSQWAANSGKRSVLALASGAAGPEETVLKTAAQRGLELPRIVLSDLFPQREAFARLKSTYPGAVDFIDTPVDVLDTGKHAPELLAICSGFHHFPPAVAKKVLANATERSDGIFIAEVFQRSYLAAAMCLLNLPLLMLAPFFARRKSLVKIAIGALLPLIPLLVVFDGVISALRVYRAEEIFAMLPKEARRSWNWDQGVLRYLGLGSAPWVAGSRARP